MAPARKRSQPGDSPTSTKVTPPSSTHHTTEQSQTPKSRALPQFLNLPNSALESRYTEIVTHELENIRTRPDAWHSHPISHTRDRYSRIRPWTWNAISLSALSFPYVNASPVSLGPQRERERFIATQGPLEEGEDGFAVFWELVWQEGSEIIVMLTEVFEEGKAKCGMYFPGGEGDVRDIEGFGTVECVCKVVHAGTEVRQLKIVRRTGGDLGGGKAQSELEERTVWHFLFLRWPDFGVPTGERDVEALLALIKMSRFKIDVRSPTKKGPLGPRIVHCSAGVGRTGTFIALDYLLQELKDEAWADLSSSLVSSRRQASALVESNGELQGDAHDSDEAEDPVYKTVMKLREQRTQMVYNQLQYAFIYQVLRKVWEAKYQTPNQPVKLLRAGDEDPASPQKRRRLSSQDTKPELTNGCVV